MLLRPLAPLCVVFFALLHNGYGVRGLGTAAEMVCTHIPGLTDRQRATCRAHPDGMIAVGQGIRLGLTECQHQFANHRWNCTAIGNGNSFGQVLVIGSKEAAFTYAIVSAGVAHAVAAACSRGNISSCGCQQTNNNRVTTSTAWKWGGCSVDIRYGMRFARKFLDAREIEGDARSLMNLQNNKAGRTAVKSGMVRECSCHGVSGSCSMRTCWGSLPQFRQVGDTLMKKYWGARPVRMASSGAPGGLVTRRSRRRPARSELVFLEPSPNYCDQDLSVGSLGTQGRSCNRSSHGIGGCDVMCCGRGYNTHQVVRTTQCNCKFLWCCYVQCQTCTEKTEVYTCKK